MGKSRVCERWRGTRELGDRPELVTRAALRLHDDDFRADAEDSPLEGFPRVFLSRKTNDKQPQ